MFKVRNLQRLQKAVSTDENAAAELTSYAAAELTSYAAAELTSYAAAELTSYARSDEQEATSYAAVN